MFILLNGKLYVLLAIQPCGTARYRDEAGYVSSAYKGTYTLQTSRYEELVSA